MYTIKAGTTTFSVESPTTCDLLIAWIGAYIPFTIRDATGELCWSNELGKPPEFFVIQDFPLTGKPTIPGFVEIGAASVIVAALTGEEIYILIDENQDAWPFADRTGIAAALKRRSLDLNGYDEIVDETGETVTSLWLYRKSILLTESE